jgi:hypothetical protein
MRIALIGLGDVNGPIGPVKIAVDGDDVIATGRVATVIGITSVFIYSITLKLPVGVEDTQVRHTEIKFGLLTSAAYGIYATTALELPVNGI